MFPTFVSDIVSVISAIYTDITVNGNQRSADMILDFRMRHGREFQDIIAVSIRDDAIAGAFNLDGNSYQRISFGINNTAFHKSVTFFLNFYNTHLFAHACRRGSMDCSH